MRAALSCCCLSCFAAATAGERAEKGRGGKKSEQERQELVCVCVLRQKSFLLSIQCQPGPRRSRGRRRKRRHPNPRDCGQCQKPSRIPFGQILSPDFFPFLSDVTCVCVHTRLEAGSGCGCGPGRRTSPSDPSSSHSSPWRTITAETPRHNKPKKPPRKTEKTYGNLEETLPFLARIRSSCHRSFLFLKLKIFSGPPFYQKSRQIEILNCPRPKISSY